METKMTGAQAVVECIRKERVKHVFCVPGESYLDVMDAIYDSTEIDLISTRHEGGASFAAEAYAKASGNVSVAMATRGVGASNLSIGIHTAYQDSTPMVVFLGQVDRKFRGREGFQEVDLDRFFQHICKWTVEIQDVERVPELVQRAFRVAKSGRPGPVVVSLPADLLPEEAEMNFGKPIQRTRQVPIKEELDECLALVAEAKNPIIIAGGGVKLSNGEEELKVFAEKLNIPVISAFRRHDVFPNNHPLYLGHLGLGTLKEIQQNVEKADLIVAIGTRFSEVTTQSYTIIKPHHKIIHLDIDENSIGKAYSPEFTLLGDAKATLAALSENIDLNKFSDNKWREWAKERRDIYESTTSLENLSIASAGIEMKYIIQTLQKKLPKNSIITNDAGNFSGWLHTYYQFTEPQTYIGPTSGAMGYGFPAALGAKLAAPHKTVVSLSGDGGFMMTMQEIETAIRYQIPVIALVFNNNMYGTIRMHQEKHFPERVIGTDLGNVDFIKLAEAMGASGKRVKNNEEFEDALNQALSSQKANLIEIMCDPEKISVKSTIENIRKLVKS